MDLSPVSKFGLVASQVAANTTDGSSTHSLCRLLLCGLRREREAATRVTMFAIPSWSRPNAEALEYDLVWIFLRLKLDHYAPFSFQNFFLGTRHINF